MGPIEWSDRPEGFYKDVDEISFGLMFHSFLYPEESGKDELYSRFWYPKMRRGEIDFSGYEGDLISRFVRPMKGTKFVSKNGGTPKNFDTANAEV